VAAVSPNCVNNLLVAATPVTSHFYYQKCFRYGGNLGCIGANPAVEETSYPPPFIYNYQCSASIITYYAPTFVYLALAATFVVPLSQMILRWLYNRASMHPKSIWFRILEMNLSKRLLDATVARDKERLLGREYSQFRPYFDVNRHFASMMTSMGVLLTFGVAFPPVAVSMLLAIVSMVCYERILLGRFLVKLADAQLDTIRDLVNAESKHEASLNKIMLAFYMWMFLMCGFLAVFVLDTLGDRVGFHRSYWVLVVVPCLPLVVVLLDRTSRYWYWLLASATQLSSDKYAGHGETPPVDDEKGASKSSALEIELRSSAPAVAAAAAAVDEKGHQQIFLEEGTGTGADTAASSGHVVVNALHNSSAGSDARV